MSNSIITQNGRKIYTDDELQFVCVDFHYWGVPKTLKVPYAKNRPWYMQEISDLLHLEKKVNYISADKIIKIPPTATDSDLEKLLYEFKDDKTGKENTDVLYDYHVPAARKICDTKIPGYGQGYIIGNVYETVVMMLESACITSLDPTAKECPERNLSILPEDTRVWTSSSEDPQLRYCIAVDTNYSIGSRKCNSPGLIIPVMVVNRSAHKDGDTKDENTMEEDFDIILRQDEILKGVLGIDEERLSLEQGDSTLRNICDDLVHIRHDRCKYVSVIAAHKYEKENLITIDENFKMHLTPLGSGVIKSIQEYFEDHKRIRYGD